MSTMNISDIKDYLKESNLFISLVKVVLILIFELDVVNIMATVENIDPNVLLNMAGTVFQPTEH